MQWPSSGCARCRRLAAALAGAALVAAGCSSAATGTAGQGSVPAITTHEVLPATADASSLGPEDPSIVDVGARSTWNGRLLVFLAGSGGKPSCCEMFLAEAATLGFHSIGLTYDNATAVGARCLNDLSCYGTVRQNVFDGSDPSVYSSVSPQDGVEHRLVALLSYLQREYPEEGWGAFVAGSTPDYPSIVMSGHSQGGGEAAFIGTMRQLAGVVSLSSPPDTNDQHEAAPWLSDVRTGRTAPNRYYGFVHNGDPFESRIRSDWSAMGLDEFGPVFSVDSARAPYDHSHELVSSADLPGVVLAAHDSTAVDEAQPLCPDGDSMYVQVWRYLLQSAAGLNLSGPAPSCPGM